MSNAIPQITLVQTDDGVVDLYSSAMADALAAILSTPGAFLECHSRRLAWSADSACYVITNGDDDDVYVTDLLAALRELRGPEAAEAEPDGQGRLYVVKDGPGF